MMRATDIEDAQLGVGEVSELRPLGALEHLFWLIDQERPMHFAVAAEIAGTPTRADWRRALYLVQQRHPMLSARIKGRPRGVPWLCRTHSPIPLRAVEAFDQSWEAVVGQELATPFDPHASPLLRAVLVQGDDRCVLVLVAHHAIADGMSLVYLIRDAVRALGAAPLEVLPMLPAQDDLFALTEAHPTTSATAAGAPPGPPATFRYKDGAHPTVASRRLGPELTSRLRERARREGSSVHGAICAAVATAGRRLSGDWRQIPLRIFSPVNSRPILGIGEDCGLFVGGTNLVFGPEALPFWDAARHAAANARAAKSASAVRSIIGAVEGVLTAGANAQSACAFAANAFGREGFVTNLGAVPVDFRPGAFKVTALWGPMVLSGFEGDQSIGAASLEGSLHLTHASYTPFPGLLAEAERDLAEAC